MKKYNAHRVHFVSYITKTNPSFWNGLFLYAEYKSRNEDNAACVYDSNSYSGCVILILHLHHTHTHPKSPEYSHMHLENGSTVWLQFVQKSRIKAYGCSWYLPWNLIFKCVYFHNANRPIWNLPNDTINASYYILSYFYSSILYFEWRMREYYVQCKSTRHWHRLLELHNAGRKSIMFSPTLFKTAVAISRWWKLLGAVLINNSSD